jgi:hybrid cluster-associated redox disulfide protein
MVIAKNMSIIEVVQKYPKTVEVFRNYGMGCLGCAAARFENIEQGATAHGIDVEALVADLNKAAGEAGCGGGGCCGCGS